MDDVNNSGAALKFRARRMTLACGLCLGLLFLLGLTGMASVTLLYDDGVSAAYDRGFETSVLRTVIALKTAIRLIHSYGSYLAIVLAGWAAVELFRMSKVLASSEIAKARARGRALIFIALVAGVSIIGALVGLSATGVKTHAELRGDRPAEPDPMAAPLPLPAGPGESVDLPAVVMHTRDLNLVLMIGVFLMVIGVSVGRQAAKETATTPAAEV